MEIEKNIKVSVVMGSQSDWDIMQLACDLLEKFDVSYEKKIVSAHRTPDRLYEYANSLRKRKIKVVIAGAGGAAHLPGMIASKTDIPVIGVPINATDLRGVDSLYSIVQMPKGYPVATMAIGSPGAFNAAIFAIQVLAVTDKVIGQKIRDWRADTTNRVKNEPE
jgi:5-(carboxyamino)imidazole ribonucleotide mutase